MKDIILARTDTKAPESLEKEAILELTAKNLQKIGKLQTKLYASHKFSLLIILQGVDASGKDSSVKKVFRSVNPQGMKVKSFKRPTEEENDHDFLWRVHHETPATGVIGIFNRSHYESVIAASLEKKPEGKQIGIIYKHINHFEALLTDSNTHILKFYLHISADKQKHKIETRKHDLTKKWKYDPADNRAVHHYLKYTRIYEDIFKNCSVVPWHIIPADQKWYRNFLLSKIILEEMESMKLRFPKHPLVKRATKTTL